MTPTAGPYEVHEHALGITICGESDRKIAALMYLPDKVTDRRPDPTYVGRKQAVANANFLVAAANFVRLRAVAGDREAMGIVAQGQPEAQ